MTTTLKLDWTAERVGAVLHALNRPDFAGSGFEYSLAWADLGPYLDVADPGATIKLDWSGEMTAAVLQALGRHLADSADDPEVRAAVLDIRGYREAVEAVLRGE